MTAPANFPLPWCDALDCPYYAINLLLCYFEPGWIEKQSHKPMSVIIPLDR
ncbi:hypothetical protein [Bradyrhizobium sp. DASA03120]|uniref:hypothetical protein n=1 Tax=Bradyrhizobium sp. SMVTL-02 TaxID=3395917 RepID=UPI003F723D21